MRQVALATAAAAVTLLLGSALTLAQTAPAPQPGGASLPQVAARARNQYHLVFFIHGLLLQSVKSDAAAAAFRPSRIVPVSTGARPIIDQ